MRCEFSAGLCGPAGDNQDAERLLREDPAHDACRKARVSLTRMAAASLCSKATGNVQMDVVFYKIDALKRFRNMTPDKVAQVKLQLAALGRSALKTNDPDTPYQG